jgi:APA family basic amino acid/polyamine antiporter
VGAVVALVAAVADVRGAIGFSAFAVLVYYAIANASAMTLEPEGRRRPVLGARVIPAIGLAGCVLLAVMLPITSVLVGAGVVLIGALGYWLRRQYSS